MEFNDLTPEQRTRARECESVGELVALAQSEGVELSDEQLEAVAGGAWNSCDHECGMKHLC